MESTGPRIFQYLNSAPVHPMVSLRLIAGLAVCCGLTLAARAQETPRSTAKSDESGFVIRSQSNLIVVPVIVRDANGKPVSGLTRDDFEVFDNKKPQAISHFSVETPENKNFPDTIAKGTGASAAKTPTQAAAPQRFIGIFFDDYHLEFGNLAQMRAATKRYLEKSLDNGAKVAIFSASGGGTVEFTNDRSKLEKALTKLHYEPVFEDCVNLSTYLAQLVEELDPDALATAEEMVRGCYCREGGCPGLEMMARVEARQVVAESDRRAVTTLTTLERAVGWMAEMPGERTIAMLSDGFSDEDQQGRLDALIDRALRASVVINALDAMGVSPTLPNESEYVRKGAQRQADILAEAAEGTGGVFVNNTNDLEHGLARIESRQTTYVLGFSPENLKANGGFHQLQVKLVNAAHFTVQARSGYFANPEQDTAVAEKEAMENAIFSREDVHGLPIEISTRLVKVNNQATKIDVEVAADMHSARFRKADGRNLMVALFDGNGNYIMGKNQVVKLSLTDAELQKLEHSGGEGAAELNAKPGNYLIRRSCTRANPTN